MDENEILWHYYLSKGSASWDELAAIYNKEHKIKTVELFDIESIYSNKITDIRSNVVMCHIFCLNI